MHKKGKPSTANSVLPPELWEEICKRLVLSDRVRFSSVGFISPRPDVPPPVTESWPLLNYNKFGFPSKNRFHCLSDKRVYTFGSVICQNCRVLGTSRGWLLTNHYIYDHFYLVNPILNVRMRIIPQFHVMDERINKLIVVETKLASAEYTVIVLTAGSRLAVFINSGYYYQDFSADLTFDIAFYKGKIHGLVIKQGRIEIHVSGLNAVLERIYVVRGIATKGQYKAYLVESSGELLIVKEQCVNFRPVGVFEVFKLVMANGFADAIRVQSLGDQALFFGSHGFISLAVGEFSLFEENHIYFLACPFSWGCDVRGVSLKDGSSKQICREPPIQSSAIVNLWWFVPTTKDIAV